MTITKMMITSTPMIVPIRPLFTVPPFPSPCPDERLGETRAAVRLPLKAILVYNVKLAVGKIPR